MRPRPATPPSSHALSPVYLSRLVGLSVACPVEQDNPTDCPLHELRALSMPERYRWASSRTNAEAEAIFALHAACDHHAHQQPDA